MARNGSGTYSLPVAPFTPGTTISSSDVNSDFSDIATALTGSIAADGQTGITGQLKGALGTAPTYSISGDLNTGFGSSTADTAFIQCGGTNIVSCTTAGATITGNLSVTGTSTVTGVTTFNAATTFNATITLATAAINETSTTLASASTVNIGAAAANYIFISGAVLITAFDTVASGIERTLEFQSTPTLNYNATTLILPGSANIVAAAGDTAIFRSEGSGNWRCISYVRRAAVPILSAAALNPTIQAFASGTGTYTAAAGVVRQRVRLVGGGGGGGARTTNAGTNGTSSTFKVNNTGTAWVATLGAGGAIAGAGGVGGASGTDGSTGTRIIRCFGADGGACSMQVDATGDSQSSFTGGAGGSSVLGGAGMPAATTGGAAKTNSGSGGAGGNSSVGTKGGGGGGAGEYVEFWVTGMATAPYVVGAKGTGGAAGGSAGGDGADGVIIVEEFYS